MKNNIYFATADGKLVDNFDIVKTAMIVDGKRISYDDADAIRNYVTKCNGIKREIENPSVKYLVKRGCKFQAVKIYRERHPEMTLSEAKEVIDKIDAKLKSVKKGKDSAESADEKVDAEVSDTETEEDTDKEN